MTVWTLGAGAVLGAVNGQLTVPLILLFGARPPDEVLGSLVCFPFGGAVGSLLGALLGLFLGIIDGLLLAAVIISAVRHPFGNAQLSTLGRRTAIFVISSLG